PVDEYSELAQIGYVMDEENGYRLWFDDGEYYYVELYGSLLKEKDGFSGDLWLFIETPDEEFDQRLLTFTDFGYKALFGIPVPNIRATIAMSDLIDAFAGKEDSDIDFVSSLAEALTLFDMEFFRNAEFHYDLVSNDKEFGCEFRVVDEPQKSSVSFAVRGFRKSGELKAPTGESVEFEEIDDETKQVLTAEFKKGLEDILAKLQGLGYDLSWMEPYIATVRFTG
ncbi:MAG: hypothetical protein LBU58_00355, partial [Clostridiales bacterium]|nr:hypothetical protein [Clostridiales bacterium]